MLSSFIHSFCTENTGKHRETEKHTDAHRHLLVFRQQLKRFKCKTVNARRAQPQVGHLLADTVLANFWIAPIAPDMAEKEWPRHKSQLANAVKPAWKMHPNASQ